MYSFSKVQDNDGIWRFELDGINLLIDGYYIKDDKHWIEHPQTAIAFFNLSGHLYSISNDIIRFNTVEELYDSLLQQYLIFTKRSA